MHIVLLSGGSGKRLWPLSNDIRSKQFIPIFHQSDGTRHSMAQRVCGQVRRAISDARITIATSKAQVSAMCNQLGDTVDISVEPCRRDTFPAIALVSAYLHDVKGVVLDEAVAVCPVDPYVEDTYFASVRRLAQLAAEGTAELMLMGIEPSYPSEKYGYIMPQDKENVTVSFRSERNRTKLQQRITLRRGHSGTAVSLPIVWVMFWNVPEICSDARTIGPCFRHTIALKRSALTMPLSSGRRTSAFCAMQARGRISGRGTHLPRSWRNRPSVMSRWMIGVAALTLSMSWMSRFW